MRGNSFISKGLRSRLSCNISVNIIHTIYLILSFLQSVFLHSQKKSFNGCGNSPAISLRHYQIIIDPGAGEIIQFGSVRPSVRLSGCLFVSLFETQIHTNLPLSVQGLCVCVCNQFLFRHVAPSRSIALLIYLIDLTSCIASIPNTLFQ